eukprot:7149015-Prymnesium_polylepis.3
MPFERRVALHPSVTSRSRATGRRARTTAVRRWHSNSRCQDCAISHRVTLPLTAVDIVGDQLTGLSSADACNCSETVASCCKVLSHTPLAAHRKRTRAVLSCGC